MNGTICTIIMGAKTEQKCLEQSTKVTEVPVCLPEGTVLSVPTLVAL